MEKKKIIPMIFLICFLLALFAIQKNTNQVLAAPQNHPHLQSTQGVLEVPLTEFEVSFTDYGEGSGSGGTSCLTRGVRFINKGDHPINIYLYYVNQDGKKFTLQSGLVDANSSTNVIALDLGVIRLGGAGSIPGYVLPYAIAASYPDQTIVNENQNIAHPCDGYLGISVSENAGPIPEDAPTATTTVTSSPQLEATTQKQVSPTEEKEPETSTETALLTYVFLTGTLDGFENTPEGQNLSIEQRSYIRNALIAMGLLLPNEIDFYVYPDKHPCEGYTSRNVCQGILENKKDEIAQQLVLQEIANRAAERVLLRQRAQRIVTEEISNLWSFWDYIKNTGEIFSSADPLETSYEKLTDKAKNELKDKINERIKNNTDNKVSIFDLQTYDDVIKGGVKLVVDLATIRSADDYEYYRNIYNTQLRETLKSEDSPETAEEKRLAAHQTAMQQLTEHIKNGFPGRAAYLQAYERAFLRLNRLYGEQ